MISGRKKPHRDQLRWGECGVSDRWCGRRAVESFLGLYGPKGSGWAVWEYSSLPQRDRNGGVVVDPPAPEDLGVVGPAERLPDCIGPVDRVLDDDEVHWFLRCGGVP